MKVVADKVVTPEETIIEMEPRDVYDELVNDETEYYELITNNGYIKPYFILNGTEAELDTGIDNRRNTPVINFKYY